VLACGGVLTISHCGASFYKFMKRCTACCCYVSRPSIACQCMAMCTNSAHPMLVTWAECRGRMPPSSRLSLCLCVGVTQCFPVCDVTRQAGEPKHPDSASVGMHKSNPQTMAAGATRGKGGLNRSVQRASSEGHTGCGIVHHESIPSDASSCVDARFLTIAKTASDASVGSRLHLTARAGCCQAVQGGGPTPRTHKAGNCASSYRNEAGGESPSCAMGCVVADGLPDDAAVCAAPAGSNTGHSCMLNECR
jgi:hypothetical protein